jgi:hypothetical protein
MRCIAFLTGLLAHRRGAVSILAALALPCLIGTAGLVVEYGHGVLEKVENQRVADLSAYAGAVAYNAATSNASTAMTNAAQAVAVLNGYTAAQINAQIVSSPTGTASTNAVKVTVTTSVPLTFSRLLGSGATLAVPAEAYAELRSGVGSCILALSGSAGGVALTGGTTINAPACAVNSNAAVSVPCGTHLVGVGVTYNTTISQPCAGIVGSDGTAATVTVAKKPTVDPLASSADIATARSRLTTVAALVAPTAPAAPAAPVVATPTGTFRDIDLAYSPSSTQAQAIALVCTAAQAGSIWTLSCPAGTHNFKNVTVGGGLALTFNGVAGTIYNFSTAMSTAAAVTFGNGVFTFMQGLTIGYGGASFGTGTLNVIGALSTGGSGGTATFASANVNVTGNASFTSTTSLSGNGTLAVGGALTTNATTSISQPTITVTGAFSIGNTISLDLLKTLKVGGLMSMGTSGTMSFGAGTSALDYAFASGLSTGGSTTITVAAGTFSFGRMAAANDGAQYSIYAGSASMTIGGPSIFLLNSGIDVKGGSTVILGNAGTDNSFRIGPSYVSSSVTSNAVLIGGGSTFKMGDATGTNSVFEIGGPFNIASGGGSCTVMSAAAQHDINGSLTTAGATILGAGVYTVYGSVGIGANGGGNVTCNGATTGLLATDVSIVVGGNGAALTGSCAGQAFCVAAGYSNVLLSARTAGVTQKMAIIGPASLTGGAYFTEGASGTTLSGLVYFPVGTVRLDGAASVGNGTGQCLQLIGKEVLLNGGSLLASTCISGNGAGGGGSAVVLVK